MVLHTSWAVSVNGRPVTDRMNPYLESIEVTDKAGETGDTATLVFDDADGQVMLPPKGSPIAIDLQGMNVFKGVVDQAESSGARGSGMQLTVSCTSHDKKSKIKQRLEKHKDDASLEDFLKDVAKDADIDEVKVDQSFKSIKRSYWSTEGRSFLQLGQELADELGGTFKIQGRTAILAKRGAGATPGGGTMGSVSAIRGQNLLSWRLQPYESRPRFKRAKVRWYDRKSAQWKTKDTEIGAADGGDVTDLLGAPRADEDQAGNAADGAKADSEREGGSGEVTLLLTPEARAEGACQVSGVRPGIDGAYRIESVTHTVSRKGAETRLSLKQPQGEAGTDGRKAG